MTIITQVNKAGPYDLNGIQTVFPYAFLIPTSGDVRVVKTDVDGNESDVNPVNFAISGVGDPAGGNVTYTAGVAGEKLTILRELDLEQNTRIRNQRKYFPDVIEDALDNLEMQIQQVNEKADRSVKVPVSSDIDPNVLIAELTAAAAAAVTAASNAATSETNSANSASASNISAVASAASAALAESWAIGLIGARPEGSAKYWAEQAQTVVGGSLAGLSVLGRAANTTGATAAITAGTDNHVLRRSGTSIGFGLLNSSSLSFTPALLTTAQTFSGAQRTTETTLTSSAASIATNLALNNDFTHTMTENTTLANPSNIVVGQKGRIVINQHASAPKTLAYGSYFKFPGGVVPSVSNTNGATDVLYYDVVTTTKIVCNLVKGFA